MGLQRALGEAWYQQRPGEVAQVLRDDPPPLFPHEFRDPITYWLREAVAQALKDS